MNAKDVLSSLALCSGLTILLSVLDVLVVYKRDQDLGSVPHIVTTFFVLLEALKFLLSLIVHGVERFVLKSNDTPILLDLKKSAHFIVPAALYAVRNNVVAYALRFVSVELLSSMSQSRIVFTAVLMWIVLRFRMHTMSWFAVVFATAGAGVVMLGCDFNDWFDGPRGLILAVFAASLSAGASVYLEWRFKSNREDSLNVQNAHQYFWGLVVNSVIFAALDGKKASEEGFFRGYDGLLAVIVVISALSGLMVSLVIKRVNNMAKVFSQTVALVLVLAFSTAMLDFQRDLSGFFAFGCVTTILAIVQYGYYDLRVLWRAYGARKTVGEIIFPTGDVYGDNNTAGIVDVSGNLTPTHRMEDEDEDEDDDM